MLERQGHQPVARPTARDIAVVGLRHRWAIIAAGAAPVLLAVAAMLLLTPA